MHSQIAKGTFGALCAGAATLGVLDGWSHMLIAWCVFGAYLMMYLTPPPARLEPK
jgi:hypothetical protein